MLRALGYGAGYVGVLFLGKALVLGCLAAVLGFVLGTVLALTVGPAIFTVTSGSIVPLYSLLWKVVVAAPLFAALCTLIPSAIAASQDPAIVLSED